MPRLPTQLFDEIITQILPYAQLEEERRAWLASLLNLEKVFDELDWSGSAKGFAAQVVLRLSADQLIAALRRLPAGEEQRLSIEQLCAQIAEASRSSHMLASGTAAAPMKPRAWITVLFLSLAVAIVSTMTYKAWEVYGHHPVGPEYVQTSMRFEDGRVLVFVRNNSDEPLDLVRARLEIREPELVSTEVLGAYPDVSKIYDVKPTTGTATIAVSGDSLLLNVSITQAIAPKAVDHFGVALDGLAGPVDLSKVKLHAQLEDIKGNRYTVAP